MKSEPQRTLRLRTAAWYGDRELELEIPPHWGVEVYWPKTPRPLAPPSLAAALESPVSQPPLRELARGKERPVIIVDDLTRPTPANVVLPLVLRQLETAGLPAAQITLVIGGGTHRAATREQALRKLGSIGAGCRVIVHDQHRDLIRVGRTSFGSPVLVNREVAMSDLLIGIAGVYPQHSVGFGGGSKILLGVLGRRSIISLHYGHPSVAGTYDIDNEFRHDLDEMARLVGLQTVITLHVDADRRVVRAVSGDHHSYYPEAVEFSRTAYAAPLPNDADVVVANAYPMDVSLTFARSKGLAPLYRGKAGASRILIAACSEGLGHHGLFPYLDGPRFEKHIHRLRRLSVVRPSRLPAKIARRLARLTQRKSILPAPRTATIEPAAIVPRQILFHRPPGSNSPLPGAIPGMSLLKSWNDVIQRVTEEQGQAARLKVAVYPCSPLHCLDLGGAGMLDHLATSKAQVGA